MLLIDSVETVVLDDSTRATSAVECQRSFTSPTVSGMRGRVGRQKVTYRDSSFRETCAPNNSNLQAVD